MQPCGKRGLEADISGSIFYNKAKELFPTILAKTTVIVYEIQDNLSCIAETIQKNDWFKLHNI